MVQLFIDGYASLRQAVAMDWHVIKIWMESTTGLDRDALHIYCALAIQLPFALFFRRRLGSVWPWIAVLTAGIVNEYLDYQYIGDDDAAIMSFREEALRDMWNTMLLPTVLLFIARFWPQWMTGKPKKTQSAKNRSSYASAVHPETVL